MVDLDMLGDFIAEQRRRAGMTQEDLAEKSGVCVRTIRNLETKAQRYPRKSTIELLLDAVSASCSVRHLIGYGQVPTVPADPSQGPHVRGLTAAPRWPGLRPGRGMLVGRGEAADRVAAAVIRERTVMLTGPGGVGKTRLAFAVAEQLRARFRHGVGVVDLGRLSPERGDPARSTKRVREEFAATIATLTRRDGDERTGAATGLHALLIADNCEHVASAAAEITDAFMTEHPLVHVLLTSRRHLSGLEAHTWNVQPLSVEPAAAGQAWPDAVELFLRLVRTACPTLDLGGQTARVTELCRRLGGLPYAIELAASRMRGVSLEVLLQEGPGIALLNDVRLDGHPHQQTLSASLQWSHDLLNDDQQSLLRRLAQLPGSFTSHDVKRMAAETTDSAGLLGVLADLVDASLVALVRGHQYRYRLQPFVAEYVTRQLRPRPPSGGPGGTQPRELVTEARWTSH
jgi:predicted ATPase/transcriptional regulator with XRE-family HTH domain